VGCAANQIYCVYSTFTELGELQFKPNPSSSQFNPNEINSANVADQLATPTLLVAVVQTVSLLEKNFPTRLFEGYQNS
jgi:hypothetical protein